MSFYNSIEQVGMAEFKDKGSKFFAYAYPFSDVNNFKKIIHALKLEHKKANHFCFAYRIGNDKNIFRSSDDGEPSGTAGKPILGQIDSNDVTNVLIIVVRYFGGTLLGVPGLINAYKSAASMALQVVPFIRKPVLKMYTLQFDYTQMNDVLQILKQNDCEILSQENQLFSTIKMGVSVDKNAEVLYKLNNLRNIEVS